MERLTYKKSRSRWDEGKYPTKYTSRHTFQEVVARLAAYEDTMPLERLQELARAEKDGRLVVPPCKVGDTIYWADIYMGQKDVEEYQVEGIDQTIIFKGHTYHTYIPASRIGKDYFLTRKEAETALTLKKREAGDEAD